jgi:threonine/homoserine/homoserine lactone efflux protein
MVMQPETMLVFAATVMPLVCTPGPDILFVASQGLSGGTTAAMRANLGVLLGYSMHALLAAFGVAAVVAASPVLFEILRWVGVAYLAYLAMKLIRSAMRPGRLALAATPNNALVRRGYLTSFLHPKGLMVYFAILPNFITSGEDVALQSRGSFCDLHRVMRHHLQRGRLCSLFDSSKRQALATVVAATWRVLRVRS